MDLDTALALTQDGDGWAATVPQGWGQGRTTFGGLVAGYLVRAVEHVQDRPVRGVDVTFLEPVPPGPVRIAVDAIREGKYLSHAQATLHVAGTPAAAGRFLLADDRPGPFDEVPAAPEVRTALDDCTPMPYIEGLTPEFTKHLQIRYGEGPIPYTGAAEARTGGFVRTAGPASGVAAMLAHIDAWPPPVLGLATTPMAASTVRWHVLFHADQAAADGLEWSWFASEAAWRSGRLATATGSLVRDGRSVAYAEQTVAMYLP
jgi:acyl-CoA thioesterase